MAVQPRVVADVECAALSRETAMWCMPSAAFFQMKTWRRDFRDRWVRGSPIARSLILVNATAPLAEHLLDCLRTRRRSVSALERLLVRRATRTAIAQCGQVLATGLHLGFLTVREESLNSPLRPREASLPLFSLCNRNASK